MTMQLTVIAVGYPTKPVVTVTRGQGREIAPVETVDRTKAEPAAAEVSADVQILEQLTEKVEKLSARVATLEQTPTGETEAIPSDLVGRIANIAQMADATDKRLHRELDSMVRKIDSIGAMVEAYGQASPAAIEESIARLEKRVEEVEQKDLNRIVNAIISSKGFYNALKEQRVLEALRYEELADIRKALREQGEQISQILASTSAKEPTAEEKAEAEKAEAIQRIAAEVGYQPAPYELEKPLGWTSFSEEAVRRYFQRKKVAKEIEKTCREVGTYAKRSWDLSILVLKGLASPEQIAALLKAGKEPDEIKASFGEGETVDALPTDLAEFQKTIGGIANEVGFTQEIGGDDYTLIILTHSRLLAAAAGPDQQSVKDRARAAFAAIVANYNTVVKGES